MHDISIDHLIDTKTAARVLSISPGTLAVWRCIKRYDLPYVKIGRAVRYRLSDLQEFLRRQLKE